MIPQSAQDRLNEVASRDEGLMNRWMHEWEKIKHRTVVDKLNARKWHKVFPHADVPEAKRKRCLIATNVALYYDATEKRSFWVRDFYRCKNWRECENCRKVREEWGSENFKSQVNNIDDNVVIINTVDDTTSFVRALKGKENYLRIPHDNGEYLVVKKGDYNAHSPKLGEKHHAALVSHEESPEVAEMVGKALLGLPDNRRISGSLLDLISSPQKKEEILPEEEPFKRSQFVIEPSVADMAVAALEKAIPTIDAIFHAYEEKLVDMSNQEYAQEAQWAAEEYAFDLLVETIGEDMFYIDHKYLSGISPWEAARMKKERPY